MIKPGQLEIDNTNFQSLKQAKKPTNGAQLKVDLRLIKRLLTFHRERQESYSSTQQIAEERITGNLHAGRRTKSFIRQTDRSRLFRTTPINFSSRLGLFLALQFKCLRRRMCTLPSKSWWGVQTNWLLVKIALASRNELFSLRTRMPWRSLSTQKVKAPLPLRNFCCLHRPCSATSVANH